MWERAVRWWRRSPGALMEPWAGAVVSSMETVRAMQEEVPGLRLIGTAPEKSGVLSFVLDGIHAHDIGTVLDAGGVAIRTGHHCAQPVMERFGVPATARASLSVFNRREDLDALIEGLGRVHALFG